MDQRLKIWLPAGLLALAGLFLALRLIAPPPPKQITFAAGGASGNYYALAERYRDALSEHGIRVEVLETAGTGENYALLKAGQADVALLQGGLAGDEERAAVLTLGGVFYEPLWVFVPAESAALGFGDLRGLRVAAGAEGSGTRALAADMARAWGGSWRGFSDLSGQAAATALLAGQVDAAVFSASVETSYIRALLQDASVRPLAFEQANGISMTHPALAPITLYEGVIRLDPPVPSRDVPLIAAVAQLGVDRDMHPALQAVLLEAADDIHRSGNPLTKIETFPNPVDTDLPVSEEAERYYRNGPTFLRRYFSFGMANFLERAWVFLIPLAAILIPLVQMAPPVYRWRTRRKIYVWYNDLHKLERRGIEAKTAAERAEVLDQIQDLQRDTGKVNVPASYNEELYQLRSHINFVEALIARQALRAG